MTAAASLVALSDGARPGDVLYGLKRGTEQTQLALAGDARGTTLLGFASTRLDELGQLVDAPNALPAAGGADAASGTVLAAGADPELVISHARDDGRRRPPQGTAWLTDRRRHAGPTARRWTTSPPGWPPRRAGLAGPGAATARRGAALRSTHSLTLLSDVSARAAGLQTALTCSSGPAVGRTDALGPVPTTCVPGRRAAGPAAARRRDARHRHRPSGAAPSARRGAHAPTAGRRTGGAGSGTGGITVPADARPGPGGPGAPAVGADASRACPPS